MALNSRVYFWATESRVRRLLGARRYRHGNHLLLEVNTASLLRAYGESIELAPYNTGSMHVPSAPRRGANVFQPIAQ